MQRIIDKVSNRLATWKARFLNKAARLKLVNTVLSSVPVYFLTVVEPKKWMIKRIDKIRRGFLWRGVSEAKGGHCLVAWETVKRPKLKGGLGVLDLEKFSRALRIRWLWYRWVDPDRPWVGSPVPCSEVDKQLFRCSTQVTLGNGRTALFWESPWGGGRAPRDLAPQLYKLAWRKGLTVREEIGNQTWTRGLWRMSNASEIAEFVGLWDSVQSVVFTEETDQITWKWTPNGQYTSKSAYDIQFAGSFCTFDSSAIWQAKVEGMHRFFAWLLVHGKIQTTDNLLAKGIACDPLCSLCNQEPETPAHLCLHCCFAQEVWFLVGQWTEGLIQVPQSGCLLQDWWNSMMQGRSTLNRRQAATISIYTAWNIWNERNRRIFQGSSLLPVGVLNLIKLEMEVRRRACDGRSPHSS